MKRSFVFYIFVLIMGMGAHLFPSISAADLNCVIQPEGEYQDISDFESSSNADLYALLPNKFVILPLSKFIPLKMGIDRILREIVSRSSIAKKLVEKAHFESSQITLIFTPEDFTSVNSWSNQVRNETYIFITPKRCNSKYLTGMLIHEIAVRADGKARDYKIIVDQLTGPSIKDLELSATLMDPELFLAFLVMRAFKIEEKIIQEITGSSEGLKVWDCMNDLQILLEHQLYIWRSNKRSASYLTELDYQRVEWAFQKVTDRKDLSQQQRDELVMKMMAMPYHLERLKTNFKLEKEWSNWCEFLSTPKVDTGPYPTVLSNGPRPSVGSGTGVKYQASGSTNLRLNSIMENYITTRKSYTSKGINPFFTENQKVNFFDKVEVNVNSRMRSENSKD